MRVNRFRSFRSLVLAIGIHVLAIGLLIVSLEFTPPPAGQPQGTEVVQAVTVDEQKVKAEVERLEQAERRKRDEELARRRTAERELAAAKAKRQAEERRLAEVTKEKDAVENARAAEQKELEATEAKRKQEESKRQQEEERRVTLEKQRLEEEKQRAETKAAEEKKRKEADAKAEAEKKRKEAEAEAEKKRKETEAKAEAKAKAEAEKKRQDEERRARELAEQLEAEEQAARDQSEIDRFTRLIQTQIENAFTNPQRGLKCTLLVKMVPGGDVVDAKVVRSSGNVLFDRRAEIAVHKASPLPVPDDPRLFQQMREIEFIFDPQA